MDNGTKERTAARIIASAGVIAIIFPTIYEAVYQATNDTRIGACVATFICIAVLIVDAVTTYFNNDYTETAAKYTAQMRQEKLEQSEDYEGERFGDDMYADDDDEEDEDE